MSINIQNLQSDVSVRILMERMSTKIGKCNRVKYRLNKKNSGIRGSLTNNLEKCGVHSVQGVLHVTVHECAQSVNARCILKRCAG
jgi:hypothetical protein